MCVLCIMLQFKMNIQEPHLANKKQEKNNNAKEIKVKETNDESNLLFYKLSMQSNMIGRLLTNGGACSSCRR